MKKTATDYNEKRIKIGDVVMAAYGPLYLIGGERIGSRTKLTIEDISPEGQLRFREIPDIQGWFPSDIFVKVPKGGLMPVGYMTRTKRRGSSFASNPISGTTIGLIALVLVGGSLAIFLLTRKKSSKTGGRTLTQAEIATLYQQWLQQKQTNPGGVQGWLNAILSGLNNASQVISWFNAQKGPPPNLPVPGQGPFG